MFLARTRASIAVVLVLSTLSLPENVFAHENDADQDRLPAVDVRISQELSALGADGALIAQARAEVLEILQSPGSCARWFQEVDPDVANVFRSVHYELGNGTSQIFVMPDDRGNALYKHPWGASTNEYGGSGSMITINANGPFFVQQSRLSRLSAIGGPAWPVGWHLVIVGPYVGGTPEARMTILLHEVGHIIGRLPVDDGSWNGESARNTAEVLQHCKSEIHLLAKRRTNDGKAGVLPVPARQAASREKS